jgi:transposase InsO family protein
MAFRLVAITLRQVLRLGLLACRSSRSKDIETIRTPWRAPKANAYAERWIRTVRRECLDRLMVLNERHLASVLATYVDHYNRERPHRGLELRTPEGPPPLRPVGADGAIVRRDRLGGLLHEYYRKAA